MTMWRFMFLTRRLLNILSINNKLIKHELYLFVLFLKRKQQVILKTFVWGIVSSQKNTSAWILKRIEWDFLKRYILQNIKSIEQIVKKTVGTQMKLVLNNCHTNSTKTSPVNTFTNTVQMLSKREGNSMSIEFNLWWIKLLPSSKSPFFSGHTCYISWC